MTIKDFFKSTNKSMRYWLVLGVVVLVVGGMVWWSWSENSKIDNIEPVKISIPKNPVLDQTLPEKQKIIGKITFSDIEGGCWGFQGDNGERFLIDGDDKSEEIKKIPNILSKKVEIQGKIEKDIDHFCPIGDGLFELELYRIIDDNAANVSD